MSEEEIIRFNFQNILDELINTKIRPTATEIISARQPMVLLFEELMYKIDKLQKEIESKNKQIKLMQEMNLPKEIEINYISKDKIRDKIKELEEQLDDDMFRYETMAAINVLNELLGE